MSLEKNMEVAEQLLAAFWRSKAVVKEEDANLQAQVLVRQFAEWIATEEFLNAEEEDA